MDTEYIAPWVGEVIIREARTEDLSAMEWDGELIHFRNLYADAFHRSQLHQGLIWLAHLEPVGLIGQVLLQLTCDRPELADGVNRAYLYGFRIRPNYRGHGLGARMMAHVEDDLRWRGFTSLTLNVAIDNPRALRLYLRLGFKEVAYEPGIWSYINHLGQRKWVEEPARRMEKHL